MISGVKVGPSPEWLRKRLESIGARSINNIVDAVNFIMFQIGQPLHVFDANKLKAREGGYAIEVRSATEREKIVTLDGKEIQLSPSTMVIADKHAHAPIGIAGIKGGKMSGVDDKTNAIILEAATFDGVSVRKTSRALNIRTDASQRFEQVLSPELAGYGMRAAAKLILEHCGGELVAFADVYPTPPGKREVSISLEHINTTLGTDFAEESVVDVFKRLGLAHHEVGSTWTIQAPFERLDLQIPEDLIEEVARIIGYDKVPVTKLPATKKKPQVNGLFYAEEQAREELLSQGYSEVHTSIFANSGERAVANKIDSVHPFLRSNLADGLSAALEKNVRMKDLLGVDEVKLFEIGTVWKGGREEMIIGMVSEKDPATETPLQPIEAKKYENFPLSKATRYIPFSRFPFIVRDIALWVPSGTKAEDILDVITKQAGDLLVRSEKFDEFSAEGGKKVSRISFAFHLVFQSFEKTLTDAEVNAGMEKIYAAVKKEGFEVR
jgi:phenylalanyl-tRNA synthetase beta chain